MSLPAAQQRILDGIAETLCVSEPRLASMFAIFTRLTKNELRPGREQIVTPGRLDWLTAIWGRLPGRRAEPGRCGWRRALLLSQMVVAITLLVVLVGLNTHAAASCGAARSARPGAAAMARSSRECAGQAGSDAAPLGK